MARIWLQGIKSLNLWPVGNSDFICIHKKRSSRKTFYKESTETATERAITWISDMDIAPQKSQLCFAQPFHHSGFNQLSLHESRSTAEDSLQVAQDSRIVPTCNLLVKYRKRIS